MREQLTILEAKGGGLRCMDESSGWVGGHRGSPVESGAIGHGRLFSMVPFWGAVSIPHGMDTSVGMHSLVGFDLTFRYFRSQ